MRAHEVERTTGARAAPVVGAPWLPHAYVPRKALWSRLDAATRRAVTVVVAPAGAGKTLGVAGWLQHLGSGTPATWITADRTVSVPMVEAALDDARAASTVPGLVVIDDAHELLPACIRLIDQRLDHDPNGLRLVLVTRWDLALSRLVPQLLGHLTVIRGDALRLTDNETRRLVAEHARTDSPEICEAIAARALGWCSAVVLAARASAAAQGHTSLLRRDESAGPGVADLVAGEVFATLGRRERHLLLCTSAEPTLTADTAKHLTHDPLAGETLAGLESTGLLVCRVSDGRPFDGTEDPDGDVRFRIHPLLLEVARRRIAAGGVDVQQAHATVLRAARLDLARGYLHEGFRRLMALGEYDAATEVLAEHGPRLLTHGHSAYIDDLLGTAGQAVDQRPDTWATIASARWVAGDTDAAAHWSSRLLRRAAAEPGSVPVSHTLCMRLRRARSGAEPVAEAVAAARSQLGTPPALDPGDPFLPMLLLELGVAENWLGDLVDAERHLGESIMVARAEALDQVVVEAQSHLALNQFMAGRECACDELAQQALDRCAEDPSTPPTTRARAQVAHLLVRLHTLPWPAPGDHVQSELPGFPDDLAARFWHRILQARVALVGGDLAEAQRRLEMPFEMPVLPDHLRVALLVEQAFHALMTGDRDGLRTVAATLGDLDAPGGRAWVEGALADLDGDLRRGAMLYLEASTSRGRAQPATAALGLVGAAQLHEHLPAEAPPVRTLLLEAVRATETRRNSMPFLGWSTHGTRVGQLLELEPDVTATAWGDELLAACAELTSATSILRSYVATPHELRSAVEPIVPPTLSARQHEVLRELARGSTYADIAANLFVSENTVKTHVSGLYAKLAVGRRSEALAVARKLHLL